MGMNADGTVTPLHKSIRKLHLGGVFSSGHLSSRRNQGSSDKDEENVWRPGKDSQGVRLLRGDVQVVLRAMNAA